MDLGFWESHFTVISSIRPSVSIDVVSCFIFSAVSSGPVDIKIVQQNLTLFNFLFSANYYRSGSFIGFLHNDNFVT